MSNLRSTIAAIQSGRLRTFPARLLKIILVPFGLFYWLGIAVRGLMYATRLMKSKRCPGKVISIGNITTGGTGKTPVTLLLAEWLQSRQIRFAVLSRGYRSPSEKSGATFTGASLASDHKLTFGDEIALLAHKLPDVWFGVGRNRHRNAEKLADEQSIGVFLLDDGFQHRQLHRDCDIVLIDATNPFGNGWLLPAGALREPLSSLSRADLILITRVESVSPAELAALRDRLSKYVSPESTFEVKTVITRFQDFATGKLLDKSALHGHRLSSFCGIGNPDGFTRLLAANGIVISECITFDDHHDYTDADIGSLRARLRDGRCELLLTTEKDAVKLPRDSFEPGHCAVVEISVAFVGREDIFWGKIAEVLAC